METIKKLFECSADSVVITDMDLNLLWRNKKAEDLIIFRSENCSILFEEYEKPLESGSYLVSIGGADIELKVINYPLNSGYYVIQTEGDNVVSSFLSKEKIKNFFENQAGALRSYVAGIANSNEAIQNIINDIGGGGAKQYADISYENCCRLLRFSACVNELIRYTDKDDASVKTDLSKALSDFTAHTEKLFKGKIILKVRSEKNVFIKCDPKRLEMFLPALIISANQNDPENNFIDIDLSVSGDSAVLSVSAEQMGTDSRPGSHSKNPPLHKSRLDIDLLLAEQFCSKYGGRLFFSGNVDGIRSISAKLPLCNDDKGEKSFGSQGFKFPDERFSKNEIMFSQIIY